METSLSDDIEGRMEAEPLINGKHENSDDLSQKETAVSKRKQWLILVTLTFLQFLSLSTDTFLFPFFTEKASAKKLNNIQVGIIFSGYNFSRFVGATFLVQLVLKYPLRKIYIIGGCISSACCVLFGLSAFAPAGTWFFILCVSIRLIAGLISGLLTTITTTTLLTITDFTPSVIMACVAAVVGAGYACGPAVGSLLYKVLGYIGAFMPFGGLMLIATIMTAFTLQGQTSSEGKEHTDANRSRSTNELIRFALIPGVVLIIASVAVMNIISHGEIIFLSQFLIKEFEMDVGTIGAIFLCNAAGYSIFSLVSAKLADWFGLLWTQMVSCWMLLAVSYLLLPPSPLLRFILHDYRSEVLSSSMFILQGIFEAGIYVAPLQIALNIASSRGYNKSSKQTNSMVSGLVHGSGNLGSALAPILAGVVTHYLNFDWFVTAAALMSLIMLLLTLSYMLTSVVCAKEQQGSKK